MTKIEFHIRKVTIAERIQQITSELIVLIDETPRHAEKNAMHLAGVHLTQASEGLLDETAASLDLETMLSLSIVTVREQKRRCEQTGSEPTNEKAHASNVSPFLNRQPKSQFGE